MVLKEYQKRSVETVREFLETLSGLRAKAAKARESDPDLDFDWVRKSWEKCAPSRAFVPRKNGLGEPRPSYCLKIPTGGGKTLLAAKVAYVKTKNPFDDTLGVPA